MEIDNIRAVLERCRHRGDTAGGLELAVSLGWYWITRATTEGTRWLDLFLTTAADAPEGDGADPLAWAYFIRGFLAVLKADPVSARPALQAAIEAARRAGRPDVLSEALSMAASAQSMAGHHAVARRLLDEARVTANDADYPPGRISVLQAQVLNGFFEADLGVVRSSAAAGVRLAREAGDLYALEMMLLNLGSAALLAGELEESRPLLAEALQIAGQIDDRVAQFYLLGAFGCHAGITGRSRLAARLLGASETARTLVGASRVLFLGELLAKTRQAVAATLGPVVFQSEFDAGKGLSRDRAIELALDKPAKPAKPAPPASSPAGAAGPLGKRETEVARLVADGLTNKQIGTRLFISERTVDSHVRSILNKLGFGSRAQIAAWTAAPDQQLSEQ